MDFSNKTEKLMKLIYKEYLEKKKTLSSVDAKNFSAYQNLDDISDSLDELEEAGYIETYSDYSFILRPAFVSYMENKFKNNIIEATDIITKFIPWYMGVS